MEKLWKKVVLAVVLLFSFGIFAPCVALADTATPTEIDVDVKIPAEECRRQPQDKLEVRRYRSCS